MYRFFVRIYFFPLMVFRNAFVSLPIFNEDLAYCFATAHLFYLGALIIHSIPFHLYYDYKKNKYKSNIWF